MSAALPDATPHPRVLSRPVLLAAIALLGLSSSCERRRATSAECDRIFDRLVEVELAERGLRDPALAKRRAENLRTKLLGERVACVGRPLGAGAIPCIEQAPNAEAIVHACLK